MAKTFGDVMKANRQKRIAVIIKSKGLPTKQDFTDAGKAKQQGKYQMDPMRAAKPGGKSHGFKNQLPEDPISYSFDETNPAAVEAIRDHAADLITGISKTTRDQIRDLVEEAFTDPEMDVDSLATAIDDIIDDPDRAELIARTETMQAANDGQQDAWDQAQEAGLLTGDEEKEWIATGDQRCCDVCDSMDGETVGINEDFEVDGDSMPGPPAHPNCRCTVGINAGR